MPSEAKVFIGGSRRLSRLSTSVRHRLDKIMDSGLTVVIGDANGVDRAVQRYLAGRNYERVIVFCMSDNCRNNLGNWPTREIVAPSARRDANYYGMKDRAMGSEADYGLMLWDGKSRGTLTNIEDLVRREIPVVVYMAPDKSFLTLREPDQLPYLHGRSNPVQRHIRPPHTRRAHSIADALLF